MKPGAPRRRPARPVPEGPIEALAADAERLAKGWLVAVIEQQPLSEAAAIPSRKWASQGPRVCAAAVRALGSDRELARLGSERLEPVGSVDALRAVLWSALRSAWPDCEPDQVWDLGERLALVLATLSEPAAAWPDSLEATIAQARSEGARLALLLAEPVDADRVLAVESAADSATVLATFREAVRHAAGPERQVLDDGDARAWVIALGADREQAVELGSQLAAAVRDAAPWRGAPLGASVGVAVLGADGDDAGTLIEAAEQAMFAAAAAGIEVERT
jgi:GGDEF domain-containing protein